jgi:hypothetical protein
MKLLARLFVLLLLLPLPARPQSGVETEPEIYYDLFVRDSCLTVLIDLGPFLTSRAVDRLHDGIDLAVECRAELVVPRRFWGDQLVASRERTVRLSYRKITDDYLLDPGDNPKRERLPFTSMDDLRLFLADSIQVCLSRMRELDRGNRHALDLRITTISLTDLNLANEAGDSSAGDSPVRYMFRQFLKLTDYGRREYSTKSRPFSLSELEEEP